MHSYTQKINFIESIFGKGRFDSSYKNFDIKCPICNPSDSDKKKLSIFIENDMNHCWTCGWKSRTLAPLIRRFSTVENLVKYSKISVFKLTDLDDVVQRVTLPSDFKLLDNSTSTIASKIRQYLRVKRGLTNNDISKYFVGYSNEKKWAMRAIFPSFDSSGELNYYVGRAIDNLRRRYDAPAVQKNEIIFNEYSIDWSKPVTLCEGIFDSIAIGSNSIPILGSFLNEESFLFNKILMYSPDVIVMLDSDAFSKALKLAKKMSFYNINVSVADTTKISDPGSASKRVVQKIVDNSTQFGWEYMVKAKLRLLHT